MADSCRGAYKEINGTVVPVQTQTDQPEGAGYSYADMTLLRSLGLEPKILNNPLLILRHKF